MAISDAAFQAMLNAGSPEPVEEAPATNKGISDEEFQKILNGAQASTTPVVEGKIEEGEDPFAQAGSSSSNMWAPQPVKPKEKGTTLQSYIGEAKRRFAAGDATGIGQVEEDALVAAMPSTAQLPDNRPFEEKAVDALFGTGEGTSLMSGEAGDKARADVREANNVKLDEFYGKGFTDPSTPYLQRIDMIKQRRVTDAALIDDMYGSKGQSTWVGLVAEMAGNLKDPATALNFPALTYAKTALAFGGESLITSLAQQGLYDRDIDPLKTGIDTVLGSAIGVGFKGLTQAIPAAYKALRDGVSRNIEMGVPISEKQVQKLADSFGSEGQSINAAQLAGDLNAEFRLNGATPERTVIDKNLSDGLQMTIHNFESMSNDFYQGKAQEELFRKGTLEDASVDYTNWLKPKFEKTEPLWTPSGKKVKGTASDNVYVPTGTEGTAGRTIENVPPEALPPGSKPAKIPPNEGYVPTSKGGEEYDPYGIAALRAPGKRPESGVAQGPYNVVIKDGEELGDAFTVTTKRNPPEITTEGTGRPRAALGGDYTAPKAAEDVFDPYGLAALAEGKPKASQAPDRYVPTSKEVPAVEGTSNRPPEMLPAGAKKPKAPSNDKYIPTEPRYVDWDDPLDIYRNLGLEKYYDKATKTVTVTNRKTGKSYEKNVTYKNKPSIRNIEEGTYTGPARADRRTRDIDQATTPVLDETLRASLVGREHVYDYFKSVVYKGSPAYNGILDATIATGRPRSIKGDPDGMVLTAVRDKNVPYDSDVGQQLQPLIGKISQYDPENPASYKQLLTKYYEVAGDFWSDPYRATRSVNQYGKAFAKFMVDAKEHADRRDVDFLFDYQKMLKEAKIEPGSADDKLIAGLLRKTVNPKDVPPHVFEMARHAKKQMENQVREAGRVGLLTPDEVTALLKKGNEKGYFPRVVDSDFMGSKEGRKQFVDSVSKATFKSEEDVKKILTSYLGELEANASTIRSTTTKDGRVYLIPTDIVHKLWQRQMLPQPGVRSVHLQAKRVIPEEWEAVLEPFLHSDTTAVLTKYMADTNLAIEHARRFGADDKILEHLLIGIEKDSKIIKDMALEAYYQQVGDFRSKNLVGFVEQPEAMKSFARAARAVNTVRLLTAPIMNVTQPFATGLPHMAASIAYDGANPLLKNYKSAIQLARGVKGLTKGLASNFSPAMREQADRAAAAQTTALMEVIAGFNEAGSTILGRKLGGGYLNPFEIIQNPSMLLKANGFTATEKFNRRVSYYMGMADTEGLLADYTKALAKGNRVNPKILSGLERRLWESGIDPADAVAGKVTSMHMDMAAKRFSDDVNFSGGGFKMPMKSQTFYGKLAYQFKSFALNTAGIIGRDIIGPAMKGNLIPLATAMGVTAGLMPITDFYRWVLGDDKKYTLSEKYITTAMNVYGGMLIVDLLTKSMKDPAKGVASLAGPTATTMFATGSDLLKAGASGIHEAIGPGGGGFSQAAYKMTGGYGSVKDNMAKAATRTFPAAIRNRILKAIADDKKEMFKSIEGDSRTPSFGKSLSN